LLSPTDAEAGKPGGITLGSLNNKPVAWMKKIKSGTIYFDYEYPESTPLYTHPAKTLTDDEIHQIFRDESGFEIDTCPIAILDFARAILRKAQEK
jgi:hypothetical protein